MPLPGTAHVWQVTLSAVLFLQQVRNVWYYAGATGAGSAADLITTFDAQFTDPMQDVTSTSIVYSNYHVEGVQVADDIADAEIGNEGHVSGDCLPPTNCWAFRFNRPNTSSRNGYKRLAGIAEGSQVNSVATVGTLVDLETLALLWPLPLVGSEDSYLPVVRTTQRAGDVVDPPEYNVFTTAAYINISTQNTRKIGRGI